MSAERAWLENELAALRADRDALRQDNAVLENNYRVAAECEAEAVAERDALREQNEALEAERDALAEQVARLDIAMRNLRRRLKRSTAFSPFNVADAIDLIDAALAPVPAGDSESEEA